MLQSFLCRQDNDEYHPALIASISHEFASFFRVFPCRILPKNVSSIFETYINCQNFEVRKHFLCKNNYLRLEILNTLFLCLFCFENYLILPLHMTSTYFFTKTKIIFAFRRDVKSFVQRLGQRVKYAWTSRSNSHASIGPYRSYSR